MLMGCRLMAEADGWEGGVCLSRSAGQLDTGCPADMAGEWTCCPCSPPASQLLLHAQRSIHPPSAAAWGAIAWELGSTRCLLSWQRCGEWLAAVLLTLASVGIAQLGAMQLLCVEAAVSCGSTRCRPITVVIFLCLCCSVPWSAGAAVQQHVGSSYTPVAISPCPPLFLQLKCLVRLELQYNGFERGPPAVVGELTSLEVSLSFSLG